MRGNQAGNRETSWEVVATIQDQGEAGELDPVLQVQPTGPHTRAARELDRLIKDAFLTFGLKNKVSNNISPSGEDFGRNSLGYGVWYLGLGLGHIHMSFS